MKLKWKIAIAFGALVISVIGPGYSFIQGNVFHSAVREGQSALRNEAVNASKAARPDLNNVMREICSNLRLKPNECHYAVEIEIMRSCRCGEKEEHDFISLFPSYSNQNHSMPMFLKDDIYLMRVTYEGDRFFGQPGKRHVAHTMGVVP